nr:hypothetical protein HmN_000183500 [Hymenolepis microstoma]
MRLRHFIHVNASTPLPPPAPNPPPIALLYPHASTPSVPHLKPINYASNVWAVTETSPLSVHGGLTSNFHILLLNLPHVLPFSQHMAWLLWLHLSPPSLQRNPPLACCTPKHTQLTHLQSPMLPSTLLLFIHHHRICSNLYLHLHPLTTNYSTSSTTSPVGFTLLRIHYSLPHCCPNTSSTWLHTISIPTSSQSTTLLM